jgi:hypothetical protein
VASLLTKNSIQMNDFKLDIEVKVTVKPVSPKVVTTQRGPYERNLFVVRESKKVHYVGGKTDVATFVTNALKVAGKESLVGLDMPKVVSVDPYDTLAATTVNINATGDNQGVSTVPTCEYGTTKTIETSQAASTTPDATEDGSDTAYVFALTELTAETKYYYRIKLASSTGTSYSELKSFTTPAA